MQYDSGRSYTISDYFFTVKKFSKFLRYGNVDKETPYAEEIRWIKKAVRPNERKELLFPTGDEIVAMVKVASSIRDRRCRRLDAGLG
ncbi:MAG: hypothetical protein QW767_06345 [Thermoprotei archaeon]